MAKVIITEQYLEDIADAIRAKNGSQDTYYPSEMAGAIEAIDTSGVTINNQNKSVTPTESSQSITADSGYTGLGTVTVGAISSSYVGSGVTQRTSTDLSASGATVTAPAGYYAAAASKAVSSGTEGTPTATKGTVSNHSISVTPSVTNTTGYITGSTKTGTAVTVSASELVSGTLSVTTNGTKDVTNYASVNVSVSGDAPTLQAKTYTVDSAGTATVTADSGYDGLSSVAVNVPSALQFAAIDYRYVTENGTRKWKVLPRTIVDPEEGCRAGWIEEGVYDSSELTFNAISGNPVITPIESAQTIGGANYMMEGAVTVNAIPSNYVGSGITQRSSSDLTASGATVTVPSGYYSEQASKAVAGGTAGTPTATKGTVSNHSVAVTPSVTNTTGYITGGTKTGTAVTVSASELVSGTYTVDSSGTKDVTNYASASVPTGTAGTPSASKGAVSNHSVSVTPSVTNTTGWITGSTKTGTAVTVSASELVSGSQTVTTNDTYDVTNLAELVVNVSGGGGVTVTDVANTTGTTCVITTGSAPSEDIPLNTQLIDFTAVKNGYIVDGDTGEEIVSQWSSCSDFTLIDPTMTFSYIGYQWYDIVFYNTSKNYISSITMYQDTDVTITNDYAHGTLTPSKIPSTAKYVRINSYPTNPSSTQLSLIRTA